MQSVKTWLAALMDNYKVGVYYYSNLFVTVSMAPT